MKLVSGVLITVLILLSGTYALAGSQEDLNFARGLFARQWFDWAEEVAKDLIDSSRTSSDVRGWAAELQIAILTTKAKKTGDDSFRQQAEALTVKYQRQFPDHPAWGAAAVFALLQRKLESAQDFAKQAEIEPNEKKKAELTASAVKVFEEVASRWEDLIKKFRQEVAAYPPKYMWGQWAQGASRQDQQSLLDKVWKRNLAEYLYATSFIYYAKVVPKDKKNEVIERGLKKFARFIDGDVEFEGDMDPAPQGIEKPIDPEPRDTFRMLIYLSEIAIGQCFVEVGNIDEAIGHFDYMIQAELPEGSETSETDIRRIVDIRLQAYYLEAYAFNLAKKHDEAVRILTDREIGMFYQSGKPISPHIPAMLEYWEKQNRPEVARMPNARENVYGKLAAFQLAKALTALGRYSEGIEEAYKIFAIEQGSRKGGQVSPFEVEAAKTMAELSKQVSTVKFPIGAAFAVARGFQYQEQWEEAIMAFRKVYGAPGSQAEVKEYAPKALFELGKLLYSGERYLESGIAFTEICERFQDFPQIGQAATLLKQSFRKAREMAKKSGKLTEVEEEWFEKSKKLAMSAVPASLEPIKEMFTDASERAREGNYELAADSYENIPKSYEETNSVGQKVQKPVPFYAYARAQLGYCYYIMYTKTLKKDPEEAKRMLKKAVTFLDEALNEAAEFEDAKAEATARYYLAKCMVEDAWGEELSSKNAKKALSFLAGFEEKFQNNKTALNYMPDVLATMATAYYKLRNYDKLHDAFQKLEKNYAKSPVLSATAFELYDLMKAQGDNMATADAELAVPYYEKASYYIYSWYKSSKNLKPESILWAGNALHKTKAYDKAVDVLMKYFEVLPPPDSRTEDEKKQATSAKVMLAQAYFGKGEYEAAAGLFDLLRRTVACTVCGYEKVLTEEEFNKPLEECPNKKCKRNNKKLEKINDTVLPIQEGAAKSYMAMYEEGGQRDAVALNKAQDIYQRIFKRLQQATSEDLRRKYWETGYTILKIYFYKREFDRVVGEIKNLILLSSEDANPDNPTEEDWKRVVPFQPWRDKIKDLYEKSLKAGKGQ